MAASRRKFLELMSAGGVAAVASSWAPQLTDIAKQTHTPMTMPAHPQTFSPLVAHSSANREESSLIDRHPENYALDNLQVSAPPNERSADSPSPDRVLNEVEREVMHSVFARLKRVQTLIGYGNFNVVSWDETLKYGKSHSTVGEFSTTELNFIEHVFSMNVATIGFYGDKVVEQLSSTIPKKEIKKIPGTGHYLYKGIALDTYQKIRRDIGDTVVLTSGIRSIVKQIYLFLNKTIEVDGNLSLASYSLAPPGHSYHAIGDFDVGKVGFGIRNFTDEFSETDEFKRLSDFGYFDIRYPQNNPSGVRYEPWHIKVV